VLPKLGALRPEPNTNPTATAFPNTVFAEELVASAFSFSTFSAGLLLIVNAWAFELNLPTLSKLERAAGPNKKPLEQMLPAAVGSTFKQLATVVLSAQDLAVSQAGQHARLDILMSMHEGHFQEPLATANKFPQPPASCLLSLLKFLRDSSSVSSSEPGPSSNSQSMYQVVNLLRDILPSILIFLIVCRCSSSQ